MNSFYIKIGYLLDQVSLIHMMPCHGLLFTRAMHGTFNNTEAWQNVPYKRFVVIQLQSLF